MQQILFAEDDAAMRDMVADLLHTAGYQVRLAADGFAALGQIRRSPPDLVILDYRMNGLDGFEVCREIRADSRLDHLPVLILTAAAEREQRLQGFGAGATDYLGKPFDGRELLARVSALLRLSHGALDRNPTTHLPGSRAIEREFERCRAGSEPFALCHLDLDHFKPFSDHFGFSFADQTLRLAGEALAGVRSARVFAGHLGGDDFVLICPSPEARAMVERVRSGFWEALTAQLPEAAVAEGSYRGVDRYGTPRRFPLTRLSAAIVHLKPGGPHSLQDLSRLLAEIKKRAKRPGGGGIEEEAVA